MAYITRAEWGAQPPKSALTPWRSVLGTTIHWEGSSPITGDIKAAVRGIQAYHQSHEYDDIAYNELVSMAGDVYEGRGVDVQSGANGTSFSNQKYYAICLLMGGDQELTQAAKDAVLNRIIELSGSFPFIGNEIWPHQHWFNTACPGPQAIAWISTIPLPLHQAGNEPILGDDDMPKSTDVVDAFVSGFGAWELTFDGGVRTVTGPFWGAYPSLDPAARQGSRGFYAITARVDGVEKPGYTLWATDGGKYTFGPGLNGF